VATLEEFTRDAQSTQIEYICYINVFLPKPLSFLEISTWLDNLIIVVASVFLPTHLPTLFPFNMQKEIHIQNSRAKHVVFVKILNYMSCWWICI